jgi:uncharacterized membrane protein
MNKKIFLILFIIALIRILYSFESLPTIELRTHPLTEIKKVNSQYFIGRVSKIRLSDDKDKIVKSTKTDNQTEYIIESKLLFKNEIISASRFNWGGGNKSDLIIRPGDYVIIEKTNDNIYYVNNYLHIHIIGGLILLNIIFAILFVRKKILYLIIIIFFSFILVNYFIFPLITKGVNAIFLTIISLLLIFTFVLFTVYGKTKDFVIGLLSIISSLFIMILLTYFLTIYLKISGFWEEEYQALKYFSDTFNDSLILNIRAILIATLIISSAGALLDVIINIISAVRELINNNKELNDKQIKKSAYTIGFDIASTMSNTLIFIFLGTSLISFIYYTIVINPNYSILNDQFFVTEIMSVIIIILSFFITVKLTVFFIMKHYF